MTLHHLHTATYSLLCRQLRIVEEDERRQEVREALDDTWHDEQQCPQYCIYRYKQTKSHRLNVVPIIEHTKDVCYLERPLAAESQIGIVDTITNWNTGEDVGYTI